MLQSDGLCWQGCWLGTCSSSAGSLVWGLAGSRLHASRGAAGSDTAPRLTHMPASRAAHEAQCTLLLNPNAAEWAGDAGERDPHGRGASWMEGSCGIWGHGLHVCAAGGAFQGRGAQDWQRDCCGCHGRQPPPCHPQDGEGELWGGSALVSHSPSGSVHGAEVGECLVESLKLGRVAVSNWNFLVNSLRGATAAIMGLRACTWHRSCASLPDALGGHCPTGTALSRISNYASALSRYEFWYPSPEPWIHTCKLACRCTTPACCRPRSATWAWCTNPPPRPSRPSMPRASRQCAGTAALLWPRCSSAPCASCSPPGMCLRCTGLPAACMLPACRQIPATSSCSRGFMQGRTVGMHGWSGAHSRCQVSRYKLSAGVRSRR